MNNTGSREIRDDPTQSYFTANGWIRSFSKMISDQTLKTLADNIPITQDNLFGSGPIFYNLPSILDTSRYITLDSTGQYIIEGSDFLTKINTNYKIRISGALFFDFFIYKNNDISKELHISLHPFVSDDISKIGKCHMTFGALPVGGATGDVCDLWFRYNNDMIEILLTKCYQIFNYKIIYLIKNALDVLSLKLNEALSTKLNRTNHLAPVYIHINDDIKNLINVIYLQYKKKYNSLTKFEYNKGVTINLMIRCIKHKFGKNLSIINIDNDIIILELDNTLCDLVTNAETLIAKYRSDIAELESNIRSINTEIQSLEKSKNKIISDKRDSGELFIEIEKTDKIITEIETINRDCLEYEAFIEKNKSKKKRLESELAEKRKQINNIPISLEEKYEKLNINKALRERFEKKALELEKAIKECKTIFEEKKNELTDSIEKVLITDLVDPMVFAVRKYILDKLIANDFALFLEYYNIIKNRGGYRNKYLKYKAKYLALKKAFYTQE